MFASTSSLCPDLQTRTNLYKEVAAKLSPPRGRHTKIRRSEWESRAAALNTEEKRKKPTVI